MRLGCGPSDFPDTALSNATTLLRRIEEVHSLRSDEWTGRSACRRLPFLSVAFDRVDSLSTSEPDSAVYLAEQLLKLVPKIEVLDSDRLVFASLVERWEFQQLARSVLGSALAYAGRTSDSEAVFSHLDVALQRGSDYLRAEVLRRRTLVRVERGELEEAREDLELATGLFGKSERPDMAALCMLRRGNVANLIRRGQGAQDYAVAAWFASQTDRDRKAPRDRADRVACAAAINLARDFHDTPAADDREILRYVKAAKASYWRPSRTRATVILVEGLLAARAGAFRDGMRQIANAMSMFANLKAYSSVAASIAEYLTIGLKWEPESLEVFLATCRGVLRECEASEVQWIAHWLASTPTRERTISLREEALARSTSGCPARVQTS